MPTPTSDQKLRSYKILKSIKQLPEWPDILSKLVSGATTPEELALYLVADLQWTSPDARNDEDVVTALTIYKGMMQTSANQPPGAPAPPTAPGASSATPLDIDPRNIDPLGEIGWLWMQQKARVKREMELEASMGKLFPTTFREIAASVKILETMQEMRAAAGLVLPGQRAISAAGEEGTISTDDIEKRHGPAVSNVLQNPHSRQKVLSIGSRLDGIIKRLQSNDAPTIDVTQPSKRAK